MVRHPPWEVLATAAARAVRDKSMGGFNRPDGSTCIVLNYQMIDLIFFMIQEPDHEDEGALAAPVHPTRLAHPVPQDLRVHGALLLHPAHHR